MMHGLSSVSKESVCNAGNPGLIPGLGRPPGEGNGTPHCSVLAWRIPWTEEPGRLQSLGSQESDTTYRLKREMGFVALRYVGSSRIRDQNQASFTGRQILYQ